MFRIKICGITRPSDAQLAFEAGADAIGLNLYHESPRFVSAPALLEIVEAVPGVQRVGVFVNAHLDSIFATCTQLDLTATQLHGDEPAEFLATCNCDRPIIRARRIDERGVAAIAEDLQRCEAAGRLPDAVLVDAYTPGRYGGTGETVSWAGLADYRKWLGNIPLILAGGLTPENVAEAIRTVRPHGVDVASGVEISPGVKDAKKLRSFIETAKSALEAL